MGCLNSPFIIAGVVAAGLLLSAPPGRAEIYKYEDREGRFIFIDRPIKGSYRLLWRSGTKRNKQSTGESRMDWTACQENRVTFTPLIDAVARRVQLHPELLHAVVRAESCYDPQAISRTGAIGLMQLMPGTASRYGVNDSRDPRSNLEGGARYLRDLLRMFRNDLSLALAAYNAGENAVKKHGKRVPPFPETQEYVKRVLDYYQSNRRQQVAMHN